VPSSYTPEDVAETIAEIKEGYCSRMLTITTDNAPECARLEAIAHKHGVEIYVVHRFHS